MRDYVKELIEKCSREDGTIKEELQVELVKINNAIRREVFKELEEITKVRTLKAFSLLPIF